MRPVTVILGVLVPALAIAAEPKPRPKLAVLGVRAESGVSQGTANLLSELISTDVMHTNQYDVLTAADVATLIGVERQRQMMGCNQNDNCFIELGQALGTDLILDASVGTVGNLRVLAVRLYDTTKSRAVGRESITVNDESALVDAARLAVNRVLGIHTPAAGGAGAAGTELAATTTPAAKKPPLGWLIFGAGAVLAAGGAVVGGLALGDFSAYKANPANVSLGNEAKTKAYVADALYATALVAAAVGIIILVVGK